MGHGGVSRQAGRRGAGRWDRTCKALKQERAWFAEAVKEGRSTVWWREGFAWEERAVGEADRPTWYKKFVSHVKEASFDPKNKKLVMNL